MTTLNRPNQDIIDQARKNLQSQKYTDKMIEEIISVVSEHGMDHEQTLDDQAKIKFLDTVFSDQESEQDYKNHVSEERVRENLTILQKYLRDVCRKVFSKALTYNPENHMVRIIHDDNKEVKQGTNREKTYDEGTIAWAKMMIKEFSTQDASAISKSNLSNFLEASKQ